MKKRILALVLSVAMVLGAVSFTAFADASAGTNYAAGEGAYYLLDVPETGITAENHTTSGTTAALPVVSENGEQFINFANPYQYDADNNLANYTSLINVGKITYGQEGIPDSVVFGDGNAETTEDLKNTHLAIRIKVNDNRPAYVQESTSIGFEFVKTTIDPETEEIGRHKVIYGGYQLLRWLDLNDGSMTYFKAQSGYNRQSNHDRIDFTGDMDGYVFIPLEPVLSGETNMIFTEADIRKELAGLEITCFNSAQTEDDKATNWLNKQLLIGDMFIVNDIEKFATARSDKRGDASKMYRPNVDDTAIYAARIGGYRNYIFARHSKTISFKYLNTVEVGGTGSYDTNNHMTTLPNGDRVYQFIANPAKVTKNEAYAYLVATDTYDGNNLSPEGKILGRATLGDGKQGVPEIIDLSKVTSFAFRVATKDGTVENEPMKFTMHLSMCKTDTSNSEVKYALQAGDVKYFDVNTGKAKTLTADESGVITLTENIDGYIIVPITQFKDFTLELARTNWGGHIKNYMNQAVCFTWKEGWANGKALYAGDVFFVEDAVKFQEFHCPHTNKVAGAVVAPTCKEKGYTPVTCPDCGLVEKTAETDTIAHDKKIEEPAKAPTCKEAGYSAAKRCSMCGEISEMSAAIDPIAHDKNVDVPEVPATCKTAGTTAGKKCSMCGEVQEGCTAIAPIAHDKLGGDVAGKAATCKEAGVEAAKKCSMCGEISEGGAVIAPIAHDKNVDVAEVPATCKTAGTTAGKKCSMCGEVQEGCTAIAPIAHDKAVDVAAVDATCTTKGATAGKKCSMCGEVQEGCEEIAMLAHDLEKVETVAPTATEKGYDVLDCKNCDYTEKNNYVDALGNGDVDDDDENKGNEEDDENKSPNTGDNNLFVMIMMIVALGAATVLFTTKKRANR